MPLPVFDSEDSIITNSFLNAARFHEAEKRLGDIFGHLNSALEKKDPISVCRESQELIDHLGSSRDFPEIWDNGREQMALDLLARSAEATKNHKYQYKVARRVRQFQSMLKRSRRSSRIQREVLGNYENVEAQPRAAR